MYVGIVLGVEDLWMTQMSFLENFQILLKYDLCIISAREYIDLLQRNNDHHCEDQVWVSSLNLGGAE